METANDIGPRRQAIITALSAELERQAQSGASRIDVEALADAVEQAIDPTPPTAEGKRPSELNATNDD
ncbi:hypothetical protein SAMN06295905_2890 [Devosia lucknowensis]|uniref:Uncharacterized protein n=1 Tax=Devosia lucknowensis TaxID=1096929 RepID=A0A1Y6G8E2_9HYPH|nr:hypothetical protein [Devosia lucknowensis]SMQ85603.1 hypothetical protein SAMN06295905_2890 [Devosia lucknowensis]